MVTVTQEVGKVGRRQRKPSHRFQLRTRPWQIQPFMIAPVLPGETMKNLLCQARVVSDPVKNPLIGWWTEYYWFYVKHRDLDDRDDITQMFLDPAKDMSAYFSGNLAEHYHTSGRVDWVKLCLNRVVDTYFRAEGESHGDYVIGNLPASQVNTESWMDSVINDADYERPDVNIDLDASGTVTASEVDEALRQWQWLRANNMTSASYEDFLRSYGVRVPQAIREETHWPELMRYIREWSYPSNTVNPADGKPSSALSWSIAERADKDRFFREPGFLFGVTVARPKIYFGRQTVNASTMLDDALAWLPAVLRDDPYTSMRKFAAGTGPIVGNTDAYWVDIKDLYMYGDQFVNFALTETDAGIVALPTAGLNKRFPSAADADALFVGTTAPTRLIRQDGVVTLTILSALDDYTATV